jgi:hypothetical protein
VETYIGARFVELEVLGPMASLPPGAVVRLVERWDVTVGAAGDDDGSLRELAARIAAASEPLAA